MLKAIVQGKKVGSGLEGKLLHIGDFKGAEDLLTACVFARLSYLSNARLIEVLQSLPNVATACPADPGAFEEILFWPHFFDEDSRAVIPDVVIILTNTVFIIEAKRYDDIQQQYAEQLSREWKAVARESDNEGKVIIQIALGGHGTWDSDLQMAAMGDEEAILCPVRWKELRNSISQLRDPMPEEQRLVSDIEQAFELHGLAHQCETFDSLARVDMEGWSILPRWEVLAGLDVETTSRPLRELADHELSVDRLPRWRYVNDTK